MRYIVRAVKYFIYFTVIFILIMAVLVFTGAAEGDISSMFRGGYSALWKIAAIFAAISAVYPSVGFMKKDALFHGSWEECKDRIAEFMEGRGYRIESEDTRTMSFRKSGISRLTRMYEDRITISAKLGGAEVEGLRKDVFRIVTGLESRFRNNAE